MASRDAILAQMHYIVNTIETADQLDIADSLISRYNELAGDDLHAYAAALVSCLTQRAIREQELWRILARECPNFALLLEYFSDENVKQLRSVGSLPWDYSYVAGDKFDGSGAP